MKKGLFIFLSFISFASLAQENECFVRLQKAFDDRGSFTVADDMHRNVIVSFFEDGGSYCLNGKARVENGTIVSVFLQFNDETYELMEKKFYNTNKQPPTIVNGISEMIFNTDGEKFKVVFIDQLRPKKKEYKTANLPEDL
jgi:hypothetical protein